MFWLKFHTMKQMCETPRDRESVGSRVLMPTMSIVQLQTNASKSGALCCLQL